MGWAVCTDPVDVRGHLCRCAHGQRPELPAPLCASTGVAAGADSRRGSHRHHRTGLAFEPTKASAQYSPVDRCRRMHRPSFRAFAAAQQLTAAERARIDSGALAALAATGAPSASIAVVRGGEIVYEHGYGNGRIEPTRRRRLRCATQSARSASSSPPPPSCSSRKRASCRSTTRSRSGFRHSARQRRQHSTTAVDDVRVPGLLATGLCLHRHAAAGDTAGDHEALDGQGTGFRARVPSGNTATPTT